MRISVAPGTAVIAHGKLAMITAIEGEDSVNVRISETGQTHVVAVEDLEMVPGDHSAMEKLNTYDPSEPGVTERLILAGERTVIIKEYLDGNLQLLEAASKLSLKKSAFYKLVSQFNQELGALSIVQSSAGPKKGSQRISLEIAEIIEQCFKKHYRGASASYSHVWKQAQTQCQVKGLKPPGLSTVQRFIKGLDPKVVFRMKYGADAASQEFDSRPGYVHTDYPLHHAQMDHTRVDIILCDEQDRTKLIGRPWITLLVDVHTRVILGFYLSMFAPSLISVQQTVCMAALPKDKDFPESPTYGINYPYYGMPEFIGMDNAKEFHSPILEAALRLYGCTPHWRKPYKKHMGGIIESLIGTLMTTAVHFLPGTTFSNVEDRGEYDSEAHAAMTFKEFRSWFAGQILIYHGTVHSSLKCSPKEAWTNYFSRETGKLPPVVINKRDLYLDFLPEKHKPVRNNGITLNAGIYYCRELMAQQGRGKVVVKFDPYDMTKIWVKLKNEYVLTPLARASHDCVNFEYYRINRAYNKKLPPGTITDPDALLQMIHNNKIVKQAKCETKKSKSQAKKQSAAKSQHREQVSNGVPTHLTQETDSVLIDAPVIVRVDFNRPPILFDTKD
ncbi:transposase family protein [Pseudomonas capsici]|uniref:Mu transposase C-terminal domain-containing protein n=1 Tax=Pseudomonas capsici TaxID=2810614 RepID=UPI000EFE1499|nr:Mu transposase C-terminal domain-containing protein [Pseudomonas capsici]MCV4275824.1 transposase family protein [Pseudomonas capsici]RMO09386.1 Integrase catalytic subunit [Pseudomonas cichorii]